MFLSLQLISQPVNSNKELKSLFNLSTFYQYYPIRNLNLNDSIVGRTNIYLINLNYQNQFYKSIYIGIKAHFNISNSYFFTSTSNNFKGNYKIGPKFGSILLNKNNSFYFSPELNILFSNFELQDNNINSNIIKHDQNFKIGLDFNAGIKLQKNMFLTAGLSLNNFYKVNYEFNYFNLGISCLYFKDNKMTIDPKPSF